MAPVHDFDSLKYAKEWIGSLHHSTDIRGGGGITEQTAPTPVPKEEDEVTFKAYTFAKAAPFSDLNCLDTVKKQL